MRSGGNNFNYFPENKLTKMANFVQFIRMLMFCPNDWGGGGPLLGCSKRRKAALTLVGCYILKWFI